MKPKLELSVSFQFGDDYPEATMSGTCTTVGANDERPEMYQGTKIGFVNDETPD